MTAYNEYVSSVLKIISWLSYSCYIAFANIIISQIALVASIPSNFIMNDRMQPISISWFLLSLILTEITESASCLLLVSLCQVTERHRKPLDDSVLFENKIVFMPLGLEERFSFVWSKSFLNSNLNKSYRKGFERHFSSGITFWHKQTHLIFSFSLINADN